MPVLTWQDKHRPNTQPVDTDTLEVWGLGSHRHHLYCTNNRDWLAAAIEQKQQFDLIYMDPPFCSGTNYTQVFKIDGVQHEVEGFGDIFTVDAYLQFIYERIVLLKEILSPSGSIFVHCDHQQSHNIRTILDEVFGAKQFRNEIIWHYTGGGRSKRYFSRKHDSIFWYSNGDKWTFNTEDIRVPYKPTSGYAKGGITSKSGKKYLPNPRGTLPDDTWDIPILNPLAKERTGYPTQKPLALLDRIILACSNPGDRVLDPFMGSGTTGIAAIKHNRQFVGLDQNWNSIHLMRRRLLELHVPFKVGHSIDVLPGIESLTLTAVDGQWTIESTKNIQHVYAQYTDGTWHDHLPTITTVRIRVIGINGGISDFLIPDTANALLTLTLFRQIPYNS